MKANLGGRVTLVVLLVLALLVPLSAWAFADEAAPGAGDDPLCTISVRWNEKPSVIMNSNEVGVSTGDPYVHNDCTGS